MHAGQENDFIARTQLGTKMRPLIAGIDEVLSSLGLLRMALHGWTDRQKASAKSHNQQPSEHQAIIPVMRDGSDIRKIDVPRRT